MGESVRRIRGTLLLVFAKGSEPLHVVVLEGFAKGSELADRQVHRPCELPAWEKLGVAGSSGYGVAQVTELAPRCSSTSMPSGAVMRQLAPSAAVEVTVTVTLPAWTVCVPEPPIMASSPLLSGVIHMAEPAPVAVTL